MSAEFLEEIAPLVEDELQRWLPGSGGEPSRLSQAMRYATLDGGKRLRPGLLLASCEFVGGNRQLAMPAAAAIECIHSYSLVHDDLPAMDDDDLRRGRPSCHVAFDEAMAILAGDALLTHAFQILARAYATEPELCRDLVCELAGAAGSEGMVGGQALDMGSSVGRTESSLEKLHSLKTGSLITVACRMGALVGRADENSLLAVTRFGRALGLAFQIADDLLDVEGSRADLGKTPGKDEEGGKLTYPALLGLEGARRRADELVREAEAAVSKGGGAGSSLVAIARFCVERTG